MAVNFSAMNGPVANVLRRVIHAVPSGWPIPILQGPLRGARWYTGAQTAGCWLGTYELDVQQLFTGIIRPGDVVYDVGAHAGFFSLLFSRLVGPHGRVYAFEPHPENVALLRRTLALNSADVVTVIPAAVADRDGTMRFSGRDSNGHLAADGDRDVRAVTLDGMWTRGAIDPPRVVKFDVEGAEWGALCGMRRLLEEARPQLVIEFHGARVDGVDMDTRCRELLRSVGYDIVTLPCGEVHAVVREPLTAAT
jgi:FkbM family methyltransferase